jgi:hypothetical protein
VSDPKNGPVAHQRRYITYLIGRSPLRSAGFFDTSGMSTVPSDSHTQGQSNRPRDHHYRDEARVKNDDVLSSENDKRTKQRAFLFVNKGNDISEQKDAPSHGAVF